MASAGSEVNDSAKLVPVVTPTITPVRVTERITEEASFSVSENVPNSPDVNLNINSVNSSTGKDSNDNCCDREAYLDEVLQAGVSIFGGNVVRD
jgi:hypothetical protein